MLAGLPQADLKLLDTEERCPAQDRMAARNGIFYDAERAFLRAPKPAEQVSCWLLC